MLKQASIHVRLPEPLKAALEARAKADGEYTAELVRIALRAFLWPRKLPQKSTD